ncbi:MAG TPA: cyclic nucleotide-binding domain-containing protein [Gallionella sp.]|nr:cyclic nucleotide-binding domain-containing protein [Gallionella sp.]
MNDTSNSFLHELNDGELDILLRNGQKKFYAKNKLIIDDGDHSSSAYIINSGKVKVFLSDDQGKEIVLCFLEAGEYFGEMALIDKEERSAAVMTMEDTELTEISQASFRECLKAHPELAERIMLGLVTRLREANKKISSLALEDVHERVANMLIDLAVKHNGQLVIDDKPTHQHIANIVGASREMITRILKNMSADGHIEITGKQIIILNGQLR